MSEEDRDNLEPAGSAEPSGPAPDDARRDGGDEPSLPAEGFEDLPPETVESMASEPAEPDGPSGPAEAVPEPEEEFEPYGEGGYEDYEGEYYDEGDYDDGGYGFGRYEEEYEDAEVEDYEDYADDEQWEWVEEDEEEEEEEEEDEEEDELGQKKMTLVEHLDELRMRIIRAGFGLVLGMVVALVFGKWTFTILEAPYYRVMEQMGRAVKGPVILSPTEAILLYIRIALYVGILLASPWIFWQLWAFVAAGLYEHEKKYVRWFAPFSAALFLAGAMFFLFVVSFPILMFLLGFSIWLGLDPMIRFKDYVQFITNMMIVFGVCFQMPIAVLLLSKVGIVTTKTLAYYRRHVIVGILIIAAFVTSPSPVDQIALAVPMWLLYELGIFLAWFVVERKRPKDDDWDLDSEEEAAGGEGDADEDAQYEDDDEYDEAEYDDHGPEAADRPSPGGA